MSVENAAASILKRGVELDTDKRYTEALVCYQEGIQILVNSIKGETDDSKRSYLRKKVEEYMTRAETIKKIVIKQKEAGHFHEQIKIENNSTGHSYKTLFGRFLDDDIQFVLIEDPYIRAYHQCQNLLRLCELLVKSCPNLRDIDVLTTREGNGQEQMSRLQQIATDLLKYKVRLKVNFSDTLHDRQITLSTGWIIKIGRGLDIYKATENKFSLGMYDLDLRPCHETAVDIVHSKFVKQSFG